VVDGVDLAVPAGEVFGFLGPNGAGKSTTMKMLLGLTRASEGAVELLGQAVSPGRMGEVLPRIGSLIEGPSYYGHLTGRENLEIVRRIKELPATAVGETLSTVRLAHEAGKPVRKYSMGMKQRLGIAMALLGSPDLLILDEPTNGLDPGGIQEIRELIRGLPSSQGTSVMVSSHLLSEVEQMASTVGILDRGRLLFQGPLADLEDPGRLILCVDAPDRVQELLRRTCWPAERLERNEVSLPVCADELIGRLITYLVGESVAIYRVEVRRRGLEDVFLEMIAPPAGIAV
jgi:ABC-2 type transport system ATP-binding protein